MKTGIGSHTNPAGGKDEWLTPPDIINALGPFYMDPCAAIHQPWETAIKHLTILDDGLNQQWKGRIWCNPPYGKETGNWLKKMAEHGDGIALTFARTETRMFFKYVWPRASALLFLEGRLHFYNISGKRATGNAGGPSVLIAYGIECAHILKNCGLKGKFVYT